MLGQSGSTPLDLFWDVVEEEERALRGRRNDVYDVLEVRISSLGSLHNANMVGDRTNVMKLQQEHPSMSSLMSC